jgi:hypothetical protein
MSTPAQKLPEYQHPRWVLRAATWGSALVYGCAFVAANIGPQVRGQAHGWPFIYMVRELRIPGGLTIYYGPWPISSPSPPLVSFEPTWLFLNVLCGIVLTCLAPVLCLYWLRARPQPIQFSLRSLFALTTVVACLLGLFKCFIPDFGDGWGLFQIAWCMLLVAQILVHFVPVAFVATAAHRLVVLSAGSQQRRWAGVHWVAWLAIAVVGGSLMHYLIFTDTSYISEYGWPFTYQTKYYYGPAYWPASGPMRAFFPISWLKAIALTADILVCLAITAATGFVVERWIRHTELGTPVRRASFVAGTVIFGGMICALPFDQSNWHIWYEYSIWLFGIACTAFAVPVAVFSCTVWLFRRFRRWLQ